MVCFEVLIDLSMRCRGSAIQSGLACTVQNTPFLTPLQLFTSCCTHWPIVLTACVLWLRVDADDAAAIAVAGAPKPVSPPPFQLLIVNGSVLPSIQLAVEQAGSGSSSALQSAQGAYDAVVGLAVCVGTGENPERPHLLSMTSSTCVSTNSTKRLDVSQTHICDLR